jgi:hypothetical protein
MMGSGTAGEACVLTGRRFYGVEKNKRFAEVARQRLIVAADSVAKAAKKAGVGKDKPAAESPVNGEAGERPKKAKAKKAAEPAAGSAAEAEPAAV